MRAISYTEVDKALNCMASWDFAYGGHLAGDALKPKRIIPRLSEGRAWGAAVAKWHEHHHELFARGQAEDALMASLDDDAKRQREFGVHDDDEHERLAERLKRMLMHYIKTTPPVVLESLEHELLVPIPSRAGQRGSSKFKLVSYVDGLERDDDGVWLVEFKLRTRLTPVDLLQLSRQIRWYAWAYWRASGTKVVGVKVDERLNEEPHPVRMLQAGGPSHAKDQLCTPDSYLDVCAEHGVEPKESTVEALSQRRWQHRVPIMFRDDELEEAGQELVSAAKLISLLDSGAIMPLRNVKQANCNGCVFREICAIPRDSYVDVNYERRPPKRERPEEEHESHVRRTA